MPSIQTSRKRTSQCQNLFIPEIFFVWKTLRLKKLVVQIHFILSFNLHGALRKMRQRKYPKLICRTCILFCSTITLTFAENILPIKNCTNKSSWKYFLLLRENKLTLIRGKWNIESKLGTGDLLIVFLRFGWYHSNKKLTAFFSLY